MSGSNHFGSFCENQNVNAKFMNQNGRQFRLHCVTAPVDTVGVTCMYGTGLRTRHEFGSAPVA